MMTLLNFFFLRKAIKNILFISLFVSFLFSCQREKKDDTTEKLNAYLESVSGRDSKVLSKVLVVPVDKGCGFCVNKIIEFLKVFNVPDETAIILTGSNDTLVGNFISENGLSDFDSLLKDGQNFFFLNQLSFLTPVLYQKNGGSWSSLDLVPINVEKSLFNLFFSKNSNPLVDTFYNLKVSGKITDVDSVKSQFSVRLSSVKGFGVDSTFTVSQGMRQVFGRNLSEGVILQKDAQSFFYFTYVLNDSMSAVATRNMPQFNSQ